jgi:hypothetical protein
MVIGFSVLSVREMGAQEAVRQASAIVIAKVTSVRVTKHLAATPDKRNGCCDWYERLWSLKKFYYCYPAFGFSLPSVILFGRGNRAIFFLKRDQNVYRSVNDEFASCIHVITGSHPGLLTAPDKPVEQAIAEASLLPGSKRDLIRNPGLTRSRLQLS